MNKCMTLFFCLICSNIAFGFSDSLKNGKNLLIYKKCNNDSSFIVQLINKQDTICQIKHLEVVGCEKAMSSRDFNAWDSVFLRQVNDPQIHPNYLTLNVDTLILMIDKRFNANNSVYSVSKGLYYVKFNALKLNAPYDIDDLYGCFVLRKDSTKTMLKFWSNDSDIAFSFQFYVFKLGFWFLTFSDQDGIQNGFLLYSIDNKPVEPDKEALRTLFD